MSICHFFFLAEKAKAKKEEEIKEGPRTERTVDEIIASLRNQSTTGQYVSLWTFFSSEFSVQSVLIPSFNYFEEAGF